MKVGILGGGQLGKMLALAGERLGLSFRAIDPAADACIRDAVPETLTRRFDDSAALREFATGLDAITYEWENVPIAAARAVAGACPNFFPTPDVLEIVQDRLFQKQRLSELGIGTAPFSAVDSVDQLRSAVRKLATPCILKTRRLGYDGKGQFVVRNISQAEEAWEAVNRQSSILEGFVPFEAELSIVCVRSSRGEERFYPLTENVHREGILRTSVAPSREPLQARAETIARTALEKLVPGESYVGVMTLELFLVDGRLLVNEIAARVHNTGHWTIDGAVTSQFENHLRAGLGMPLGSSEAKGHSGMVNIIGELPRMDAVRSIPGAHLHLYGKEPKPGRKLGHLTVNRASRAEMLEALKAARNACGEA